MYFSELLLDKNGTLRKKGDKIKNEKYAKTLERVQKDPESFYSGELASDIVNDIKKVNGIVTVDDLRNYKSIPRQPYEDELSGMKMYLTPPPTSGAVLALILNILKGWCYHDYETFINVPRSCLIAARMTKKTKKCKTRFRGSPTRNCLCLRLFKKIQVY